MPKDGAGVGANVAPASEEAGQVVGAGAVKPGEGYIGSILGATSHVAPPASVENSFC